MAEKIQFSFEVPHYHLDDFEPYQDFHLVISTFCPIRNYIDFYKSQSDLGLKSIWLDNGFNETKKADNPHDLIYYSREVGATKVFAPDDLSWSYQEIITNYNDIRRHLPIKGVIPVLKNYNYYELFSRTYPTYVLAVPFRKRPDGVDPEWTDGQLISLCEAEWVHYLGLNTINELLKTRPNSCDTSLPIKLSIKRMTTSQWYELNCPRIHRSDLPINRDYFDHILTKKELRNAIQNIEELKKICS